MYAIVRTGGKQYQVAAGDRLKVEKLEGEVGDTVEPRSLADKATAQTLGLEQVLPQSVLTNGAEV